MKLLNVELVIESELLSSRLYSAKFTPKIGQEKYLILILCQKITNGPIKDLNGQKIKGKFYEKEL